MKNFEKYEKEIKEAGKEHLFWKDINKISNGYVRSEGTFIEWLYEDYKEPLLTDEEKEYLKVVIKPFKNISYIIKSSVYLSICMAGFSHNGNVLIGLEDGYKFKGLEREKHYSLEELGLN